MFEFIQGSSRKPTGNLLVYSMVKGHNPIDPEGRIILCNVVVSFIAASSNHFPVVVFPPVYLKTAEELAELIHLRDDYDVLRLPDFKVPAGSAPDDYIKKRLKKFNTIVMTYVEMCRDHIEHKIESFDPDMTASILSGETGPRGETGLSGSDESSLFDMLEGYINQERQGSRDWDGEGSRIGRDSKFRRLIKRIEAHYPRYDIHNLERALADPEDHASGELVHLYIKKFRAIYAEEYEKAAAIQSRIRVIEDS